MTDLNRLFRKRIGFSDKGDITIESLNELLEKTAYNLPFENLSIMTNKTDDITKNYLIEKMLVKNQGGLCYELNGLLYLFLIENNLDASLVRGVVYNNETKEWNKLGRTHVAVIINRSGNAYLVDAGFGTNLPLKPIPMTGETVSSTTGKFKVNTAEHKFGNYILEMKLKNKDNKWEIAYVFDTKQPVCSLSEFNWIQQILTESEESSFNKTSLISRVTEKGSKTLTNKSFTQRVDGKVQKEEVDEEKFNMLAYQQFGLTYNVK